MALLQSYSDTNLVIDEALHVVYAMSIIQGTWPYTSANVSGWYNTMRECHRYAAKRFRYVGMTYEAAMNCAADMKEHFTRTFFTSYWNADAMGGGWNTGTGGTVCMADVTPVHTDADAWDVIVSVREDDVRYKKVSESFYPAYDFGNEMNRGYGSDGHGKKDEKETSGGVTT